MDVQSPPSIYDPMAIPLACAAAWSESVSEAMRVGVLTWSAIAKGWGETASAYGALLGQALNVEAADALAVSDTADALLEGELHAFETAAEHAAYAAEEALVGLAGPLAPLPE